MALTAGSRVGTYEIIGLLGSGGMGQVYRARDTKLGRDVAIKILPDYFVSDSERLARFEREARTLASLNHPNIAQIYGMEDSSANGRALVMELVEGEDLAEVLARGPVPLADALPIAQQIAQALEVAHEQGIVHRDLKPANIKVRADGTVKVLDFGLAKAMEPTGVTSGNLSNSPTMTSPATALGMILGTAAYMSPEQARGKAVDRRADVWAFGVVVYEMLSGRRAFEGGEVTDVLASVLKDTIPLDRLPAGTPPEVRRLLRRCLAKNRADRLDSMATARLEITEAVSSIRETDVARVSASAAPPVRSRMLPLTLAVAGIAIGLAAGWALFTSPIAPAHGPGIVRFSLPIPPIAEPRIVTIAGDLIVYEGDRLYVRRLSDPAAVPIPGTEGAENLFLSPDGRWAAFFSGGKLKKVSLAGGDPLALVDADSDNPGGAWGPDNTVIYSPGWNAPLFSVTADGGGKAAAISTVDAAAGEIGHWWADVLPGGKSALFTVWMAATGINDAKVAVLDLATGKHRLLMPGAGARFLTSGHILFFHAGGFQIVPFDPVAGRVTGEPSKVLADAKALDPLGSWHKPVAVSESGTLVYVSGPLAPEIQLAWATQRGVIEPVPGTAKRWREVALSRDGQRVVGSRIEAGVTMLWVQDLARQAEQRLNLPGATFDGLWNPADNSLIFTSMTKGHFDAFRLPATDTVPKAIIDGPLDQQPLAVTHDGKRVAFYDSQQDGTILLTVAEIDRPTVRTRLPTPGSNIDAARFSPDDRWIAAETRASGRLEIVVVAANGTGGAIPVSSRGGATPTWSRTGSVLYFEQDGELVAATYSTAGGRFTVTGEDVLFKLEGRHLVDVGPDGRFLLKKDAPGQGYGIQVVVNWLAELKARITQTQ
jgi:eukaryotic-like serine/threonine-protein kinase